MWKRAILFLVPLLLLIVAIFFLGKLRLLKQEKFVIHDVTYSDEIGLEGLAFDSISFLFDFSTHGIISIPFTKL